MSNLTPFRLNDWQVDPACDSLSKDDICIRLDLRPMQVLVVLAQRAGEVMSPRQIDAAVWAGVHVTTNSVYQCVRQLRKALGDDPRQPQYIETIRGRGYRLIAEVHWPSDSPCHAAPAAPPLVELTAAALTAPMPLTEAAPARHWRALSLPITVLLLMVMGLVIEGIHIADARTQAESERARAEQLSKFMLDVFAASDPSVTPGRQFDARELLDLDAHQVDANTALSPAARVQLLEMIGRSQIGQCLHERAVPVLERALHLRREMGAAPATTGSLLLELAAALRAVGRFADADRAFDEAMQIRSAHAAQSSSEYARFAADLTAAEPARRRPDPRCPGRPADTPR